MEQAADRRGASGLGAWTREAAGAGGGVDAGRRLVEPAASPRAAPVAGLGAGEGRWSCRVEAAEGYGSIAVVTRLLEALGEVRVAQLCGVGQDLPARWAGGEGVAAPVRVRLGGLDALLGALLGVFTAEEASRWLDVEDAILGARPADVLHRHGPLPVLAALVAHERAV